MLNNIRRACTLTILVAALGYFVDIFDLLLFGIVRQQSLIGIGIPLEETLPVGIFLQNMQVWGLVIGGIFWGILGDKKGRLSVLFGSIAVYSIANIANAFVTTVPQYAICRLIAGFGLAGELGAAITLVGESLPSDIRGYGTTIVASVGVSGAVVSNLAGQHLSWNHAYLTGGILGLALLLLRVGVGESTLFKEVQRKDIPQGDFLSLFKTRERFLRFARCVGVGIPLWYGVGILMFYSPEFAISLRYTDAIQAGNAIASCYAGLVIGDLLSGFLSQILGSRKKILFFFVSLSAVCSLVFLTTPGLNASQFYLLAFIFGIALGYWAVFVTTASEHFGTNLRSTVTTSVPNFVRWSVSPMSIVFLFLNHRIGNLTSALLIGVVVFAIGFLSIHGMQETHNRSLEFLED